MKRMVMVVAAGLALGGGALWALEWRAPGPVAAASSAPAPALETREVGPVLTLAVPGMTCGSCEGRITRALEGRSGVREVAVDLRAKVVRVAYDPAVADPKGLADAVTAAGYPARYLAPGTPLPKPAGGGGGCGGGCCENRG